MAQKKKILVLNGPNLNLLGKREPGIYGNRTFEDFMMELDTKFKEVAELHYYQSNMEGELINRIQQWGFEMDGILLNAGGYSHTSIAIADAVKAVSADVIGIHISNIFDREPVRHNDLLQGACKGNISGLGLAGYELGLRFLLDKDL